MEREFGAAESREREGFWAGSSIAEKISLQKDRGITVPRALLTDRDGTFSMMRAENPEALAEHDAATRKLTDYVNERGYLLMVNTGGSIGMMEGGYRAGNLPLFDAAIVAGGSELYIQKDGQYVRDPEFQRRIEELTGYNREILHPLAAEFLRAHGDIGRLAFLPRDSQENVNAWSAHHANPETIPAPTSIEAPEQNKISFYFYGNESGAQAMLTKTRTWLDQQGFTKIKLSISRDIYEQEARYQINILPLDKREASAMLIDELTETFGPLMVATAGDDTNDAEMIINSGQAGIAVGNMQPGLRSAIENSASTRDGRYFSMIDNRLVFHDPSPTRTAAESLLKGVRALELADRLITNRTATSN